jgi:tyrosyl-tRNA synthetase
MLQKESVKSRMETGISFTEFSYMLTQAYDFWHLFLTDNCELQMGGSDQWGNITAGTELIGRREGKSAHALVFPLITTASGTKFGKSEDGNVWLDPKKTSPYKFYQFWLNTDDRDLERSLKFFTFLSLEEIRRVMDQQAGDPGQRAAHRLLAEELTSRVHGAETTKRVVAASRLLFGGQDLRAAEATVFQTLADEIPTLRMARAEVKGLPVIDLLVKAGLASSKSDARRGIQGKGFSLNAEPVSDVDRLLSEADLLAGGHAMLQKGKKNYALLVAES